MATLPKLADLDKLASELADNPLRYAAQAAKHDWDFHLNIDLDAAANRFQSIPHSVSDNKYPLNNLDKLYNMYRRVDQGLAPIESNPEREKFLVLNGLQIKYAKPPGILQSDSDVTHSESDSDQALNTPPPQSELDPDILCRRQSVHSITEQPAIDLHHRVSSQFQTPQNTFASAQSPPTKALRQSSIENALEMPHPVENDPQPYPTPRITPSKSRITEPQPTHHDADLTVDDLSLVPTKQPRSPSQTLQSPPSTPLNPPADHPSPAKHRKQINPPTMSSHFPVVIMNPRRMSMPARIPSQPQFIAIARQANCNPTSSVPAPIDAEGKPYMTERSSQCRESTVDGNKDTTVRAHVLDDRTTSNSHCVDAVPNTSAETSHLKINDPQGVINSRHHSVQQGGSKSNIRDEVDEGMGSSIAENTRTLRESSQIGTRVRDDLNQVPDSCIAGIPETPRRSIQMGSHGGGDLSEEPDSCLAATLDTKGKSIRMGSHGLDDAIGKPDSSIAEAPHAPRESIQMGARGRNDLNEEPKPSIAEAPHAPRESIQMGSRGPNGLNEASHPSITRASCGLRESLETGIRGRDGLNRERDSCNAGTAETLRKSVQMSSRRRGLLVDYPPTISPKSRRASQLSGISVPISRRRSANFGLQTQLKKDQILPDAAEIRDARRRSSMALTDRRQSIDNLPPPLDITNAVQAPNGVYECVLGGREFHLVVEEFPEAEEEMKGVQCSPAEIDADMDILFAPLFIDPGPSLVKKRKIDVAVQFTGVEDSPVCSALQQVIGSNNVNTQSIAAQSDQDEPTKEREFSQNEMPKEANLSESGESRIAPIFTILKSPPEQSDAQALKNIKNDQTRCSRCAALTKGKRQSHSGESAEGGISAERDDLRLRVSERKISKPMSLKSSRSNRVLQRHPEKARSQKKTSRGSRRSKRLSDKQSSQPYGFEAFTNHDVNASSSLLNSGISDKRHPEMSTSRTKGARGSKQSKRISEKQNSHPAGIENLSNDGVEASNSRLNSRIPDERYMDKSTSRTNAARGSRKSKRLSEKQNSHVSGIERFSTEDVEACNTRLKSKKLDEGHPETSTGRSKDARGSRRSKRISEKPNSHPSGFERCSAEDVEAGNSPLRCRIRDERHSGKSTYQTNAARGSRRSKRISDRQNSYASGFERYSTRDVEPSNSRVKFSIPNDSGERGRESLPLVVVIEPGDDDVVIEAVETSDNEDVSVSRNVREEEGHGNAVRKRSGSAGGDAVQEAQQQSAKEQVGYAGCGSTTLCQENEHHVERDLGCEENEVPLMDEDDDVPPLGNVMPERPIIPNEAFESGDDDFGEDDVDERAHELYSQAVDRAKRDSDDDIGKDDIFEQAREGSVQSVDRPNGDSVARVLDLEMREETVPRSTVLISGGVDVEPSEVRDVSSRATRKGGKRKQQGNARKEGHKARKVTPNTRRKTRSKREMKRLGLSNLPVPAEAVLSDKSDCDEDQPRRSKRRKFPPLQYWKNEKKVYERRRSQLLPTVSQVVVAMEGEADVASELSLEALKARRVVASRR